jgi:hypothetical protein
MIMNDAPGRWLQHASLGKPLRAAPWFFVFSVLNACGRMIRTDLGLDPEEGLSANAIALRLPDINQRALHEAPYHGDVRSG